MALTPDTDPAEVMAVAHFLARGRTCWGALEREDFIGAACLAFYAQRVKVAVTGRDFHRYMIRCMATAIREQTRQEARAHGYGRPTLEPPIVQGFASHTRQHAGGGSASSSEQARHRRLAAQREYNKTYYYRHVGLQVCEVCGVQVERGHGARRCDAHSSAKNRYWRRWRANQKTEVA